MNPNFPQISLDLNEPETETKEDNTMNDIISINSNQPLTMSSIEISTLVDSRHDKVKQSIERLVERGVIARPPMGDVQESGGNNRTYTTQVYLLNKRDSLVVVAQLCPEFTARIVDRWQELEEQIKAPVLELNNPAFLRTTLLAYTEKVIALENKVSELTPMAAALDLISASHENMPIRIAAKVLDIKEQRLIQDLVAWHWIYRLNQSWAPYREHIDSGDLVMKFAKYHNSDGQEVEKPYCHITPKGLAKLAKKYGVQLPAAA
jgi:phage regulator Rha-like protein